MQYVSNFYGSCRQLLESQGKFDVEKQSPGPHCNHTLQPSMCMQPTNEQLVQDNRVSMFASKLPPVSLTLLSTIASPETKLGHFVNPSGTSSCGSDRS